MISGKYLLLAIPPYYEDSQGEIWLDELWYRDLVAHLDYIDDLTVFCPKRAKPDADEVRGIKLVKVGKEILEHLSFAAQPSITSGKQIPFHFLRSLPLIWRLIGKMDVIHSGVAGWPYPMGLIANPIALLKKKPLIIVVESSPWRLANPRSASRMEKLRESLNESFAGWSIRKADLAVMTSPAYRDTLGAPENGDVLITPANWVKDSDILSPENAETNWAAKSGITKLICPTRLENNKGIAVVIEALELLDAQQHEIQIDIIGQGDLENPIKERLSALKHVKSSLLSPIPYGPPFFSLLQQYDMLIAPTLGDEQPRIIFDAYSQALPVIASNTSGQQFLIDEGKTGTLYWRTDPKDLAQSIIDVAPDRAWLHSMGKNALSYAKRQTHEAMHAKRAEAIAKMLDAKKA